MPDRVPAGTPPEAPARLLVEQVSSVEHAIVAGVPGLDSSGAPQLTAGLGRPLVMTTLEPAEAMRILVEGERRRPFIAAACLAGGVILLTVSLALAIAGLLS